MTTTSSSSPSSSSAGKGIKPNSVPLRCVCGERDCVAILNRWMKIKDGKRCGFYSVPDDATDASIFNGKMRENIFLWLYPNYRDINRSQRAAMLSSRAEKYVAYHHFNPVVLKEQNQGPIVVLDREFARKYGLAFPENLVRNGENSDKYVTAPNYPTSKMFMDLESMEDKTARSKSSWTYSKLESTSNDLMNINECILNNHFEQACHRLLQHPEEASEWYVLFDDILLFYTGLCE